MTGSTSLTVSAPNTIADLVAKLSSVPTGERAREAARFRLADTAFAMLVGSHTEQGGRGARLADDVYGRRSLAGTAFRLTAACRMTEIDDVDLLSCVTPGSVVVPTVLSVLARGEQVTSALTLGEALDVIVRGYELAVGLGEAMHGPQRLRQGVWPSLAVGAVTAAVVTTLLLDGSDAQQRAASLLAAQQSVQVNPGGNAREALLAGAVVTGMAAAFAVRHSMSVAGRGNNGVLGDLLDAHVEIGDEPRILRPCVKSFCSARQAMTAVAGVRQLIAEHNLAGTDVDRIDVEVPTEYAAMLDKPSVATRRESLSSAQYQLALAVADPDGLLDVDRQTLRDSTSALMSRVHVHASEALSRRYPEQWPARVRITARGATFETVMDDVPGERALSVESITEKFRLFSQSSHELSAQAQQLWRSSYQATCLDHLIELVALTDGEQLARLSPRRSTAS